MNEEDPSFTVVNNAETHQMVLSGAGDMQLDVLVSTPEEPLRRGSRAQPRPCALS